MLTDEELREAVYLNWDESYNDGHHSGKRAKSYGHIAVEDWGKSIRVFAVCPSDCICFLSVTICNDDQLFIDWIYQGGPWVRDFEAICRIKLRLKKGKEEALKKKELITLAQYGK